MPEDKPTFIPAKPNLEGLVGLVEALTGRKLNEEEIEQMRKELEGAIPPIDVLSRKDRQ